MPRSAALVLAAGLALLGCGGDVAVESEAARLWRDAVWHPAPGAFEPALAASEARLARPHEEATPDDLFLIASSALLAGRTEVGVAWLDRLARAEPRRPGMLLLQGFVQSVRHDRPAAQDRYDAALAALEVLPGSETFEPEVRFLAHLFRGQERYFREDYSGAVRDLTVARSLAAEHGVPVHREVVRFLADSHVHVQEYAPAEEVLRAAIAADGEFPAHHFQIGMVLAAQARSSEASEAYRKALRFDPEDPRPRLKLAEIARRDGDLDGMRIQLDALEERFREGQLTGELSAGLGSYWLERGRELAAEGDDGGARSAYLRSREHLLRAVEANPLCTRAFTLLVQVATLAGRPDEEIDGYKARLEELEHAKSGTPAASDPNRTFC